MMRRILPVRTPEAVEQFIVEVGKVCGLNGNLRLLHQDRNFGDARLNVRSTVKPEDLGTIFHITDDGSQRFNLTLCDDLVSTQ